MKGIAHSGKWEPRQESDLLPLSLDRRLERAALPPRAGEAVEDAGVGMVLE